MGYSDQNGQFRLLGDQHNTLTLAQLKAVVVDPKMEAYRMVTLSDGRRVYYQPTSVLTADDYFVIAANGPGRFLLAPGPNKLEIPIDYTLADAAILATCPTGFLAQIQRCYWHVTTSWSGGSSSSIGASSSNATGMTAKGAFQGAGLAAALTSTIGTSLGTIGSTIAAGAFVRAADTIRFDQIASTYTAGEGFLGILFDVIANPGA